MSSLDNKPKSQKGKLSLQKKSKKAMADLVNIISNPVMNETCEFRSVKKMNKFFSSMEAMDDSGAQRRGRSIMKNLQTDTKNTAKAKNKLVNENLSSIVKIDQQEDIKRVKNKQQNERESKSDEEVLIIEDDKEQENTGCSKIEVDECSESQGKCPACGESFSSQDMAVHLQICLKARFQRGSYTAVSTVIDKEVKPKEEESFYCQICQKDLTKMNSQRRTQHLNKCIDKDEEEQRSKDLEKKALEEAKSMVLDCPMCGKVCKTENARKVHLKKCCQELNITTEQMLKLVKKQEEDHQMMLAAGVLPKSVHSKLKTKGKSLVKTKKTTKEPKSQYDADLQMAMAISISESKPLLNTEPKKAKKKKGPSEPAMLVALSKEEKRRRLSQRITTILIPEDEDSNIELTPEFVSSSLLHRYSDENTQIPLLWTKCSLLEGSDNKENWSKDLFYVKCLVPPIEVSKAKPGSKVRRMSEIPGRNSSFIRPKTPVKLSTPQSEVTNNKVFNQSIPEDSMIASTQTAMVLAELAADASQATPDHELSQIELNCSGFCPEVPIVVQSSKASNLLGQLQTSMLSLVNNPTHSDVQICTARSDIVYCHRALLAGRCPEILKLEDSGKILLPDYSFDTITSLMKYIYGGLVSVTESCLTDVITLAHRFEFIELHKILHELKPPSESIQNSPMKSIQDKTSVESLLKQLWSDSDDDSEGQGQNEDNDEIGLDVCGSDYDQGQGQTVEKKVSELEDVESSRLSEESDSESICKTETRSKRRKIFKPSPSKVCQKGPIDLEDCKSVKNKAFKKSFQKVSPHTKPSKFTTPDKVLKERSIIFENDELEIYSNVSSSEKSPLTDRNLSQSYENSQPLSSPCLEDNNEDHILTSHSPYKLEINLGDGSQDRNNENSDLNHYLSPVRDTDIIDREYSPEIPLLPSSQSVKLLNQSQPDADYNPSNEVNQTYYMNNSEHEITDYLPTMDSPCKVKQQGKSVERIGRLKGISKKPESMNYSSKENDDCHARTNKNNELSKSTTEVTEKKEDFNVTNATHESFDDSNDSLIILEVDNCNDGIAELDESDNKTGEHFSKTCDMSEALNASLNTSGGDLFASPSPVIQRSRSQYHASSQEVSNSLTGTDSFDLSLPGSTNSSTTFRKTKRKTFEVESPSKVIETSKRLKAHDSNDCDISIVSDNFSEVTSKQSPKFKPREKKWKFSSKSDFVKSTDITFSGSTKTNLDHSSNNVNNKNSPLDTDINQDYSEENKDKLSSSLSLGYSFNDVDRSEEMHKNEKNQVKSYEEEDQSGWRNIDTESDEGINLIDTEEPDNIGDNKNATMEYDMEVVTETDGVSHDDVWEDFDDCGADEFDGIVTCETPVTRKTDCVGALGLHGPEAKTELCNEASSTIECIEEQDDTEFENLTFCDESFIQDQPSTSTKILNDFKTPVMPKDVKQKTKVWQEPSPFTPMPNYDEMATPVIKKRVQSYGVKPVGKKRMVKLLKDIYHKTHQYETDSEFEDDDNTESDVKTSDKEETEDRSDSDEDDMSFNDSQESQNSDMLEETYLEKAEDDNQPLKPGEKSLSDKLMDFINQQSDILVRILMYEPLELDVLKQKITDRGIKCGMEKLKEFLDDKCITFTMKNMRKSPRKKRKSPKKAKSKDNSPKKARSKDSSPKKARSKDSSPKKAKSKDSSPKKARSKDSSPKKSRSKDTSPLKDPQKSPSKGHGRGKKKLNP